MENEKRNALLIGIFFLVLIVSLVAIFIISDPGIKSFERDGVSFNYTGYYEEVKTSSHFARFDDGDFYTFTLDIVPYEGNLDQIISDQQEILKSEYLQENPTEDVDYDDYNEVNIIIDGVKAVCMDIDQEKQTIILVKNNFLYIFKMTDNRNYETVINSFHTTKS